MATDTPADGSGRTWKSLAAEWALKQGVPTVILLVILAMVAWVGKFAVTEGIPNLQRQVQQGYETIEKSHREERETTATRANTTLEKLESALNENTKATQDLVRQIDKQQ
ncbi:MAG: hypothetical protein AB7I37_26155 [Pirellulales bacterium]